MAEDAPLLSVAGCQEYVTVRDLVRMFEEDPNCPGHGQFVLHDALAVGISLLRSEPVILQENRVRAGQWFHFSPDFRVDYADDLTASPKYQETRRSKMLRLIAGHVGPRHKPASFWCDFLHDHYDKIILPYNMNRNHFVVFEVAFRSPQGQYIKMWDGMAASSSAQLLNVREELDMLREVFFGGREVETLLWQIGDPVQGAGFGCGPFAFLVMCHLAFGKAPEGWSARDEAVARNYLWGCIREGRLLPLPELKMSVVVSSLCL